ncbi:MAG: hypothetical protein ACRD5H_08315, partial [Nitrososphaerales archaeon]
PEPELVNLGSTFHEYCGWRPRKAFLVCLALDTITPYVDPNLANVAAGTFPSSFGSNLYNPSP